MFKFGWIAAIFFVFATACCKYPQELVEERALNAIRDEKSLRENVFLPNHCLNLDDIIEIVLNNNLDLAVKAQQYNIQRETVTKTALNMLPNLNVNMDYNYRNNSPSATGQILSKTKPALPLVPPEVTSQRRTYQWSISLAWNLLDFGLSYFQSQAERDRLIIASMEYEKVRQNLILNTVTLYWRAIIAGKAVEIAAPLLLELKRQRLALENLLENQTYLSKDQLYAKLVRIYQREIQLKGYNDRTDSSDPTQGYEKEYENAMLDLGSLMGIRPGTEFELCPIEDFPTQIDFGDISQLEEASLLNRPELYGYDAQEKVSVEAVYAAILQELPGIQLFRTFFHDDNKYLVNKSWWEIGINSLWNLLSIPAHYYESVIGEEEKELAIRNRLVQSIAVLSQVHLGYILYEQNLEQYILSKRVADTYAKLVNVFISEKEVGKVGGADFLQTEIDASLAQINQFKIYAELQNSIEQMNNAIGLPRYFQPKD